ncbi:multi-sensor hybrid histidine kinase [Aerosticca soli]|uniref:histidine kinase n=2 Tax=Aerosticca soli TaxID=2010829 RepID=A0A2Z6E1S0_9GAMM|nr:multi-sensor hybrid histidine kinase [Aerosticca soli]
MTAGQGEMHMWATFLLGLALATGGHADATAAAGPPAAAVAAERLLPTPQFRRFGLEEGLPSIAINAVVQDAQGFLWFGGSGGLVRYDGVSFLSYVHDPRRADSLASIDITQLVDGGDGTLWIATGEAGVDRLEADGRHFRHWRHDEARVDSLASDRVAALDRARDGSLWVGTDAGLDRLYADGRPVEHVAYLKTPSENPRDLIVGALLAEADGGLWIGTWSGRLFHRSSQGVIDEVKLPWRPGQQAQVWRLAAEPGGGLRIATRQGLMLRGVDGTVRWAADAASPGPDFVFDSARDRAGRLWLATLHGVAMVAPDGSAWAFHAQPSLRGGLPGEWVWRVLVDREGGLWFTFYDGGVAYLPPSWDRFTHYGHRPDDPDSLRDDTMVAAVPAADGRLWVAFRTGVDRLDPGTGKAEHVLTGATNAVADIDGQLWFLQHGLPFRMVDGKPRAVAPGQRLFERARMLIRAADGAVYLCAAPNGLYRLDPASETVTAVPMPPDAADPALRPSLLDDHGGRLWYANHEGLMRWDPELGRMAFVPGVNRGSDVQMLSFDRQDGIWMARPDVLEHYRFDGQRAVLDRTVGAREGWPTMVLYGMETDAAGRLWLFAADGLRRFDPRTGAFTVFGTGDGLDERAFRGTPVWRPGGRLWYVPVRSGVIAFDPMAAPVPLPTPQPVLVTLGSRDGDGARLWSTQQRDLTLGWRTRELQVALRALSYVDPKAMRYRFRLRGYDPDWVEIGPHGERTFTELPPGDYRLEGGAAGSDGRWGHLAAPLHLHVQAPPWRRWWAWLVYALLAGVALQLGVRAWRRRQAHRRQVQHTEQQRRLAEQASAAKTQFLATLGHELRTPMTGVLGMAELLLSTPLDATQRQYALAMQRSGSLLLRLLNDSLDLARIEVGRLELEPVPFDPRQLVADVIQLETGPAQMKGLGLDAHVDEALPERLLGDPLRIRQILLNLVNNALKFTEAGGVVLRAERTAEGVCFSVQDTGPGIPQAEHARLFRRYVQMDGPQRRSGSGLGLAICRELVELMGGSIGLVSEPGRGSTFTVCLPLPAVASPLALAPAASAQALKVLLVEDDGIVAAVICGLLERQGHAVVHVGHALAALAELAQTHFDLMLLDLDLPGLDGFRLARLIRQRERPGEYLPIVAVTARSDRDEESHTRAAGMDGFLRKPLSGEALAAVIERVLGRRRAAPPASGVLATDPA